MRRSRYQVDELKRSVHSMVVLEQHRNGPKLYKDLKGHSCYPGNPSEDSKPAAEPKNKKQKIEKPPANNGILQFGGQGRLPVPKDILVQGKDGAEKKLCPFFLYGGKMCNKTTKDCPGAHVTTFTGLSTDNQKKLEKFVANRKDVSFTDGKGPIKS